MAAAEGQQGLQCIRAGWENGDKVDDFEGGLALFGTRAGQLGHMNDSRPGGLKIGAYLRTHLSGASLDPPTVPIHRLSLLEVSVRIGKVGRQISLKGGSLPLMTKRG